ncbi:MAG: hypothetical protein HY321_17635 [Armatimonadetes bacterium]|nr:hypothetical protein [Armatimonadota bacterium]
MTWLVLGVAVAAVVAVILMLRGELSRSHDGGRGFDAPAPLRVVSGTLLIIVFVLVAAGLLFAVPRGGGSGAPSAMMVAYWLFIGLLLLAILALAVLDMFLVRRGFQRRQDEALRDAFVGRAGPQAPPGERRPGAGSGTA